MPPSALAPFCCCTSNPLTIFSMLFSSDGELLEAIGLTMLGVVVVVGEVCGSIEAELEPTGGGGGSAGGGDE